MSEFLVSDREFTAEVSRMYGALAGHGMLSHDIARALGLSRRQLVLWVGGYDHPPEDERQAVLQGLARLLEAQE